MAPAALPIAAYKKLYEIEDESPARREQSRPVFDELVAWAEIHQPFEAPSSKLGDAIRYLLNHRVALGRFLEPGLVPIDNGKVERLHVRAALARKNFLFAGNDDFGERAAIAFTILGCCRLIGRRVSRRRIPAARAGGVLRRTRQPRELRHRQSPSSERPGWLSGRRPSGQKNFLSRSWIGRSFMIDGYTANRFSQVEDVHGPATASEL